MFKRKLALLERKLASTNALLWREFTEPSISFSVEEGERLWYNPCDISKTGWICDWEKFSDSFGDDRGNPVKGLLSPLRVLLQHAISSYYCWQIIPCTPPSHGCRSLSGLGYSRISWLSSWNWDVFLAYSHSEMSFTTAWMFCLYLICLHPCRQNQERVI